VAETGRTRSDHIASSYAFYVHMAAKKDAQDRDRIRARERIDKLLGLEDRTPPDALEQLLDRLPRELAGALRAELARQLPADGGSPSDSAATGSH
jgi:hypothetical protein